MTHTDWYYGTEGRRQGPFSGPQIAALFAGGVVNGKTLVWSAGLPNWTALDESPLASAMPPSVGQRPDNPTAAADREVASFGEVVASCFSKYATFSGRANRAEFWFFVLFIALVGIATAVADLALFGGTEISPLNTAFSLGIIIPQFAVIVRRLHDTDRTGWWAAFMLVPLVGIITLIVFWSQRGSPTRNRFG